MTGAKHVDAPCPQTVIDTDHHSLGQLIERMAQICAQAQDVACQCAACAVSARQACEGNLREVAGEKLGLLLEHFEREDQLMRQLPRTHATLKHCEGHRGAHAEFAIRYNRLVTAPDGRDGLSARIRAWKAFAHDWARAHTRHYDSELLRLSQTGAGA